MWIILCLFAPVAFAAIIEIPYSDPPTTLSNLATTTEDPLTGKELEDFLASITTTEAPLSLLDVTDNPEANNDESAKTKRCSRHSVRLSQHPELVTLSLSRRDVDAQPTKRQQQCENCLNSKLCKVRKICTGCKLFCDNNLIPSTTESVIVGEPATPLIENRLTNELPLDPTYRYYALGHTNHKPTVGYLARVFGIANKTNYEKFIVLGQTKATDANNGPYIIDAAQAFNGPPQIIRLSNNLEDLSQNMVEAIQSALQARSNQLNAKRLTIAQINEVLNDTLAQLTAPNLQESQTKCSLLDEVEEDIMDVGGRTHEKSHETNEIPEKSEQSPSTPPQFHNPPVIQGNLNARESEDGLPEGKQPLSKLLESEKPQLESDNHVKEQKPRTYYDSSAEDSSQSSSSEEQPQYLGEESPKAPNLQDTIANVVEDSLKIAEQENKLLNEQLPRAEEAANQLAEEQTRQQPSRASFDNVIEEIERIPQIIADDVTKDGDAVRKLEEESQQEVTPATIVAESSPNVETRFPADVDPNHFGALVPANESHAGDKSQPRNYYFVGKDINLPLQMVEDENGVVRLTVDMAKLCHCKSKTCPRKHLDSREVEDQVRAVEKGDRTPFQDDGANQYSEMDPLHLQSEGSDIFKRSAMPYQDLEDVEDDHLAKEEYDELTRIMKDYEFERMQNEIEMDLEKLDELNDNVKKMNNRKSDLLNRGTVALLRNGDKTERTDRMLNLANNLLHWMKDLADKPEEK